VDLLSRHFCKKNRNIGDKRQATTEDEDEEENDQ
jgi:hypothetical protein